MTPEEFDCVLSQALVTLEDGRTEDWANVAGTLEWNCWQTVDHLIDCLFSFSLQLAAQATSGFLPFTELHARSDALPSDLLIGLRGVGRMFFGVANIAPVDASASDGLALMGASDWCARAAFEIALHTYDVACGWHTDFTLTSELSHAILESPSLWMLDRQLAASEAVPWRALVAGSGRPSPT